jgi:hypothetical protein
MSVNQNKERAMSILLDESFKHVQNKLKKIHGDIARKNASIRGISATYFVYDGIIYPNNQTHTTSTGYIPPLHYSLLEEFDKTTRMMEEAGYTTIKNFFIAILENARHPKVLEELLPQVLVNKLRTEFGDEFVSVSQGNWDNMQSESLELANKRIIHVKENFEECIVMLRNLLMDKLLLQV